GQHFKPGGLQRVDLRLERLLADQARPFARAQRRAGPRAQEQRTLARPFEAPFEKGPEERLERGVEHDLYSMRTSNGLAGKPAASYKVQIGLSAQQYRTRVALAAFAASSRTAL